MTIYKLNYVKKWRAWFPARELMKITPNLYVTIANLSISSLGGVLRNYKATKVMLTSLSMYKVREKDYCAGFDCAMKDGNKLRNILNLQTQESQHMTEKCKNVQRYAY